MKLKGPLFITLATAACYLGLKYLIPSAINRGGSLVAGLTSAYMTSSESKKRQAELEPVIMAPEQVEGMESEKKRLEAILNNNFINGEPLTSAQRKIVGIFINAYDTELRKYSPKPITPDK